MTLPNQRLILLNMAASEFFVSFMQCVEWTRHGVLDHSNNKLQGHPYCYVERFFTYCSLFGNRLFMLHLIVDRLLDIRLNMKYDVYFHKGTLMRIIAGLWSVAAIIAIILDVVFRCRADKDFIYVYFGLDLTIVLTAIATYSYFYYRVRVMLKFEGGLITRRRYKFLVPFVMVLTYIVFNFTSTSIFTSFHWIKLSRTTTKLMQRIAVCLLFCGWISDAVIYIILQKDIRAMLSKCIVMATRSRRVSDSTYIFGSSPMVSTRLNIISTPAPHKLNTSQSNGSINPSEQLENGRILLNNRENEQKLFDREATS